MLKQRVLTAIVAAIVVLIALFVLPVTVTRCIVAALMLTAAWEWSGLLALKSMLWRLIYVGLIAALLSSVYLLVPATVPNASFYAMAITWWAGAFVWLFFQPMVIAPGVAWLCGALILVPAWYSIDWLFLRSSESLLIALLIVIAADTGAYFAGKQFGRVKLAPAISPGKTWEGATGGIIAVSVLAVVVAVYKDGSILVYLPLFIAIAILSIVGDLTVSVFKRNVGVKDSGRFFPGHGGVLDRIDSITAAAPMFALAMALGTIT